LSLPVGPFVVLMYRNESGDVAAGSDNRNMSDKIEYPVYTKVGNTHKTSRSFRPWTAASSMHVSLLLSSCLQK